MPDVADLSDHQETPAPSDGQHKDDPAYLEAMAKKADEGTDTTGKAKLLAGKYKTPEELRKGTEHALKALYGDDPEAMYKALESELGKRNANKGKPAETKPAETKPAETKPAEVPPPKPGEAIDFTRFTNEYVKDGKLSAESYQALEAQGFPKQMVDTYVAGMSSQLNAIFDKAGGREQYFLLTQWAGQALPESEVAAFNAVVQSNDANAIGLAVEGLSAKYAKMVGRGPARRIVPENHTSADSAGYMSAAEMKRDMADPRYETDAAFRETVMARLSLAMAAGRL